MTQVKIENIVKRFGNVSVLKGVNLVIEQSEFFTLLGPSGCGKTTLLRTIAGFLTQDSGAIYFDGECIDGIPAHKRNTGMVFQNYAIFPHLNVFDNIAYGLKNRKFSRQEIEAKVRGGRAPRASRRIGTPDAARTLGRTTATRRPGARARDRAARLADG